MWQSRAKLDDLDFVLDGLQPSQPEDVRTNSTVSLAALCKDQETRVLLRAHSLMPKVLNALQGVSKQVHVIVASTLNSSLWYIINSYISRSLHAQHEFVYARVL
jgi:hypothetical protein